ncbi:MAG: hypothetical protein OXE52_09220 [Chloroflexi bacterium]|nr:hypothetical protein [Chloroflexota bacterium]
MMLWPRIILMLIPLLAGCSAIELHEQNVLATGAARVDITASTAEPGSTAQAEITQVYATLQALSTNATESAQTMTAMAIATSASQPRAAQDDSGATAMPADFLAGAADTVVYGQVPVDGDRLNVIAALAFDREDRLLVGTRAGEIYRLLDADEDGIAEDRRLIFRDVNDELGQVSGLVAIGEVLILLNDGRLSQVQDQDRDGAYETVTHLSHELPADQSPSQANNSIVQAPDGRYFTTNVRSGEILQILLQK